MEDNKSEEKETSTRGADWEVVSLTASAFAASPGPDPVEVDPADSSNNLGGDEKSTGAMFMSGHFIFPPSEHENLPLGPDNSEVPAETVVHDVDPIEIEEEVEEPIKTHEGGWGTEISSETDDPHGIQFFDKGKRVSVHGEDFEEGSQGMFRGPGYSSLTEPYVSESVSNNGSSDVTEPDDSSNQSSSYFPKAIKKSKGKGSGFPSEAWWKKRAASLYVHAKEASTFWSLCVAAAVMGLVILGHRWQQERWQVHHLTSKISIGDEITGRFLGRISHFKDAIIGGHRRPPVLQGRPAER